VQAVRVEALAASIGVTKGGFYAHFASREQLLGDVLDEWERRSTQEVLEQVEARGGDAAERIRGAGVLTFSEEIVPLDLAVRSWARRDRDVRERLRRVDNARMNYLRAQFRSFVTDPDEVEARSIMAFTLAIGCHFLAADLAGPSKGEAVARAGRRVLFRPPQP
jgi:AcrR family transcriptional regulator